MVYSRWKAEELPEKIPYDITFEVREGIFEYTPPANDFLVDWHMNFADAHLFACYGSALLAQDELQIAEHPILGTIFEALTQTGKSPHTVDQNGNPTPVTITGVQRRCFIDTMASPTKGILFGLYGNDFASGTNEQIIDATEILTPPTITNILAISAPACKTGVYTKEDITYILKAAYTGYIATIQESKRINPSCIRTCVHTGFWGCGAFGGNRILMTILQALAADMADVDMVFLGFDPSGVEVADTAYKKYWGMRKKTNSTEEILNIIYDQAFEWGVSDGN